MYPTLMLNLGLILFTLDYLLPAALHHLGLQRSHSFCHGHIAARLLRPRRRRRRTGGPAAHDLLRLREGRRPPAAAAHALHLRAAAAADHPGKRPIRPDRPKRPELGQEAAGAAAVHLAGRGQRRQRRPSLAAEEQEAPADGGATAARAPPERPQL